MHIVLFEPEIPGNTGNIGRSCVATATTLHLVGRLGFKISGRELARAGLDYWPKLNLVLHRDFPAFAASLPADASVLVFSTKAIQSFWKAPYHPNSYLLFGRESSGLPESIMTLYKESLYRIPTNSDVRSLNLSTSAGIVLYEALRQTQQH